MIAVVVGLDDPASRNVRDQLLKKRDWHEVDIDTEKFERVHRWSDFVVVEKDGMHLSFDGVDREIESLGFDVELVVFVSRHSGDTGRLLSAHHTGNWGKAEHGGDPRSLATPAPDAHRHLLHRFSEDAPDGWQVSMEATHHGPSELSTPSVYAEVGSGEEQWRNTEAADTVADAVLSLPDREKPRWTLLGVGGGHYSPRFTRVALETEAAFGHVVPDHHLDNVEGSLLEHAFRQSEATAVVVDGEASREEMETQGYTVLGESYLRRRSGVDDSVADEIQSLLGDGWTRCRRALDVEDPRNVEAFEGVDLVRECHRTDSDAAREALDTHAVAYSTDESGEVDGVAVGDDVEPLVEALAAVLEERFTVEVDLQERRVEVWREGFDAGRAHELGVPEGPAFGRLSDGEAVEVDGRVVEPEDVVEPVSRSFYF